MVDKPAIVLYTQTAGRFGNQLLRFMHWTASALEYRNRLRVIDVAFWPYARFFEIWKKHPGCEIPLHYGLADLVSGVCSAIPGRGGPYSMWRIQKLLLSTLHKSKGTKIGRLLADTANPIDIGSEQFWSELEKKQKFTIACGWPFKCWDLLEKRENEVRSLFKPSNQWLQKSTAYINDLRKKCDLLVGVFIRQGDYREWCGGRYHFTFEQYKKWMEEYCNEHSGKRVLFLLAGDQLISPDHFSGLNIGFSSGSINSGGHWFESFLQLSMCVAILTPPSTFSACAAFIGEVPLMPLFSKEQGLFSHPVMNRTLFDAAFSPDFSKAVQ